MTRTCQWCGASPPKGRTRWWDNKPECASAFACQKRVMARSFPPKLTPTDAPGRYVFVLADHAVGAANGTTVTDGIKLYELKRGKWVLTP